MNKASIWGPAPRRQIDAPKTLADEAYQRIREDIIGGKFTPEEKLQPDVLRARYGIGLSPMREALSRLALEGLAVAEGQRGFFVAPTTLSELLDIADLRTHFSMMALERSIRSGGDDWENAVVTAYYQLNKVENQVKSDPNAFRDEWERRNRAFHEALESGCGSPWLLHFCDSLYDKLERYRRRFLVYTKIEPTIAEEHLRIMQLALARDVAVCDVMKQHFEHATRVIRSLMEKPEGVKWATASAKTKGPLAAKPPRRPAKRARSQ